MPPSVPSSTEYASTREPAALAHSATATFAATGCARPAAAAARSRPPGVASSGRQMTSARRGEAASVRASGTTMSTSVPRTLTFRWLGTAAALSA